MSRVSAELQAPVALKVVGRFDQAQVTSGNQFVNFDARWKAVGEMPREVSY